VTSLIEKSSRLPGPELFLRERFKMSLDPTAAADQFSFELVVFPSRILCALFLT
jgi:hypothetical protein